MLGLGIIKRKSTYPSISSVGSFVSVGLCYVYMNRVCRYDYGNFYSKEMIEAVDSGPLDLGFSSRRLLMKI